MLLSEQHGAVILQEMNLGTESLTPSGYKDGHKNRQMQEG
jgi:hypothetical protein